MKKRKSCRVNAVLTGIHKNIATRSRKELFFDILPWVCLVAAYLVAVLFHLIFGKELLNSDMSAEILLADLLNKEGDFLLSRNWYYSTELWVVNRHITLRLALLLFPYNWHLARTFSQAIMLALHAVSYLFLAHECELKKAGVYSAAVLMCPLGFWYMWYGTYNNSYLIFMIFITLSLAMCLRIAKGKKYSFSFFLLLLLFSFAQGLGGVRMLMNLYVPFVMASAVLIFLWPQKKMAEHGRVSRDAFVEGVPLRLGITALASSVACLAGYLVNSQILSRYYTYSSFEDQYWGELKLSSLLDVWSMFLGLFGYPYSDNLSFLPREETLLFSKSGILGALGIVTTCAVVFSAIRLLTRWKELNDVHLVITLMFWACFAVNSIVYAWIYQNTDASYWLPIVPLAIAVVAIEVQTEHFSLPIQQGVVAAALGVCVFGSSYSTTVRFLDSPPMTMPGIESVGEWLAENGWTQGYATFWNADVVTELTNGEVEMWSVWDVYGLEFYPWLQPTAHDNSPKGQVFVLLNPYEGETLVELPYRQEEYIIYSDENGFVVLGFDSAEQLFALLGTGE